MVNVLLCAMTALMRLARNVYRVNRIMFAMLDDYMERKKDEEIYLNILMTGTAPSMPL